MHVSPIASPISKIDEGGARFTDPIQEISSSTIIQLSRDNSGLFKKTVVVAAHPDDETLFASTILADVPDVRVVHVTDGAPHDPRFRPAAASVSREAYARTRDAEVKKALSLCSLGPERLFKLGAIDMEAAFQMMRLAERLANLLQELRSTLVLTHSYEGGHPDHDATALVTHSALALLKRRRAVCPELAEMPSYHMGAGRFVASEFLETCDAAVIGPRSTSVMTRVLSAEERKRKRLMLACFETQAAVIAQFPSSVERVRWAPFYHFTKAPHAGPLYYEHLGFPLSGEQFRRLAKETLVSLNLEEAPI